MMKCLSYTKLPKIINPDYKFTTEAFIKEIERPTQDPSITTVVSINKNSWWKSSQKIKYLATFMVSSENGNPMMIAHFQCHQELEKYINKCHQFKSSKCQTFSMLRLGRSTV
jgi:hypothetical protein